MRRYFPGNARGASSLYGAYASFPAPSPGSPGRRAYATDATVRNWIDDGTAWRPLIGGVAGVAPPAAAGWTAFNAPTSLTDAPGGLEFVGPNDVSVITMRGYTRPIAGGTFCEMAPIFRMTGLVTSGGFENCNLLMRESSSGKMYSVNWNRDQLNWNIETDCFSWTNNTTRSAQLSQSNGPIEGNAPSFLRLRAVAGNLYCEISRDRLVWLIMDTRTIASVFTTAPDQVGFGSYGFRTLSKYFVAHWSNG